MRRLLLIILIVFNAFPYAKVFAQDNERIRLISADSLVSVVKNNKTVTMLVGNVKLIQGVAKIRCGIAWFNDKDQYAELKRKVEIFDGKRTLKADYVFYNGKTRTELAKGNVILSQGKRVLKTPRLKYDQKNMQAEAFDKVDLTDLVKGVELQGKEAKYDRKGDHALLSSGVRIVKTDSAGSDTIKISGITAEAWGKKQQVLISDSVVIVRSRMHAVCSSALYSADPPGIMLSGSPRVWIENQVLSGNEIYMKLKELSFEGGKITGNAVITVKDSLTGKEDFMSGDTIYIEARNDTLTKVDVRSQATSIYHISEEEEEPGTNNISGDRIILYFNDEQKLGRVIIKSSPGTCSGKYSPEGSGQAKVKKKSKLLTKGRKMF